MPGFKGLVNAYLQTGPRAAELTGPAAAAATPVSRAAQPGEPGTPEDQLWTGVGGDTRNGQMTFFLSTQMVNCVVHGYGLFLI